MKNLIEMIDEFRNYLDDFAKENGFSYFKTKVDYDGSEGIYFIYHNDPDLENKKEFFSFIAKQVNLKFKDKRSEVAFCYGYEFVQEFEKMKKLFKPSTKFVYPQASSSKKGVLKMPKSPKIAFSTESIPKPGGVAA